MFLPGELHNSAYLLNFLHFFLISLSVHLLFWMDLSVCVCVCGGGGWGVASASIEIVDSTAQYGAGIYQSHNL